MKKFCLSFILFLFVGAGYSQNYNYVLIGDTTSTKVRKLMFGSVYNFTMRKDFVKNLNAVYSINQERFGFFSAKITHAGLDTLVLNDSTLIPFKEIIAIEAGGLNYYLNEFVFFGSWASIGVLNYYLLLFDFNTSFIVMANTLTGLTPLAVGLTIRKMKKDVSLVNYVIKEVRHNNIFNKKKNVFERRLKPPNKQ